VTWALFVKTFRHTLAKCSDQIVHPTLDSLNKEYAVAIELLITANKERPLSLEQ